METTIEALQQQVEELKTRLEFVEKCQSHYHATFEDNNEAIRGFAERINEYGKRAENSVAETDRRLQKALADALKSFNATLLSSFEAEVAKDVVARISSETIADSLSKRVLVTRLATREEVKSGENVVVVRPAQPYELK